MTSSLRGQPAGEKTERVLKLFPYMYASLQVVTG